MKTMQRFALAAVLLAPVLSHADFMTFSLPGDAEISNWKNLSSSNYPGYPSSYPTSDAAWPSPITGDAGSTSSATFNKVSGGGYFTSSGYIYTNNGGSYAVADSAPQTGLSTIILQIEIALELTDISLSYTTDSGTVSNILADYTATFSSDKPQVMGEDVYVYAYQWDLSGVTEDITDYTISMTTDAHAVIYGLQLNTSDVAVGQVVPEPSTYAALAGLGVLGLALLRRKLSQK